MAYGNKIDTNNNTTAYTITHNSNMFIPFVLNGSTELATSNETMNACA